MSTAFPTLVTTHTPVSLVGRHPETRDSSFNTLVHRVLPQRMFAAATPKTFTLVAVSAPLHVLPLPFIPLAVPHHQASKDIPPAQPLVLRNPALAHHPIVPPGTIHLQVTTVQERGRCGTDVHLIIVSGSKSVP